MHVCMCACLYMSFVCSKHLNHHVTMINDVQVVGKGAVTSNGVRDLSVAATAEYVYEF